MQISECKHSGGHTQGQAGMSALVSAEIIETFGQLSLELSATLKMSAEVKTVMPVEV